MEIRLIDVDGHNFPNVLTNFNSTLQEDLHRVYTIRDLGMAQKEIKDLQRWGNNHII